jgi:hypothetical protein
MAIVEKSKCRKKIVIDLTGPQGNVFFLLRSARTYAKQLKLDSEKIEAEMKSSDYENAVQTFDKYFGNYVDLER